jgi:hypothetical protein
MALVQTEEFLNRLSDGRKRIRVTLSTLALTTGVAEIKLDTLKEVTDFFPCVVTPAGTADYVYEYEFAKSAVNVKNGIRITAMTMQASAVSPTWAVANDTGVAAVKIVIDCIGI